MKKAVLIMAGGRGERFWPKSRKKLPKQFLSLGGDGKTMIQLTIEHIQDFVDLEDIYISTNKEYKDLVLEQLPQVCRENILCEPAGRNTAPCIGLGAVHIEKKYKDAVMIVMPSDHLIKYNKIFVNALIEACKLAEKESNIVTIGITPRSPETGYGYIKFNPDKVEGGAYAVDFFVEKPDLKAAKEYLDTEEYLWNSGIYIWKTSTILSNIREFLPDLASGLNIIQRHIGTPEENVVLRQEFLKFDAISIDHGITEKADQIYVLPGAFGWDDVGSWLAVGRIRKSNDNGNVVEGDIITINSTDNVIQGEKKLIAAVGIKDMIIVDTEDAILICAKNSVNDIKKVLENLRICNREEYI